MYPPADSNLTACRLCAYDQLHPIGALDPVREVSHFAGSSRSNPTTAILSATPPPKPDPGQHLWTLLPVHPNLQNPIESQSINAQEVCYFAETRRNQHPACRRTLHRLHASIERIVGHADQLGRSAD